MELSARDFFRWHMGQIRIPEDRITKLVLDGELIPSQLRTRGVVLDHIWQSICRLRNLKILSLANNQLSNIPDCITNLRNLEYLFLTNNRLVIISSLFNLSNLKWLVVNSNPIISLSGDDFRNTPSIKLLDFSNSSLYSIPEEICQLSQLESLILYNGFYNTLTLPSCILQMPTLRKLYVQGIEGLSIPSRLRSRLSLQQAQSEMESLYAAKLREPAPSAPSGLPPLDPVFQPIYNASTRVQPQRSLMNRFRGLFTRRRNTAVRPNQPAVNFPRVTGLAPIGIRATTNMNMPTATPVVTPPAGQGTPTGPPPISRPAQRIGRFTGQRNLMYSPEISETVPEQTIELEQLLSNFNSMEGAPQMSGVAFHVHNAFKKINKRALISFLIDKIGTTPIVMPGTTNKQFADYIRDTLNSFINLMDNSNSRKEAARADLNKLYFDVLRHVLFPDLYKKIVTLCLDYAKKQPDEFKQAYVSFFTHDCAHAYNGEYSMSCSKGIFERFVSSLKDAATIYADRPEYTEFEYDKLAAIIENTPKTLKKRVEDAGVVCFNEHSEDEAAFRECIKSRLRENMGTNYNNTATAAELNAYIPVLGVFGGGKRKLRKTRKTRKTRKSKKLN